MDKVKEAALLRKVSVRDRTKRSFKVSSHEALPGTGSFRPGAGLLRLVGETLSGFLFPRAVS